MSESSDQLSSPNSDCNSQMGHRSGSSSGGIIGYNNNTLTTLSLSIHQHQQNTGTSSTSPRYNQEQINCVNNPVVDITSSSIGASGTTNFSPEQIACMCEALSQSQDIEKLTR